MLSSATNVGRNLSCPQSKLKGATTSAVVQGQATGRRSTPKSRSGWGRCSSADPRSCMVRAPQFADNINRLVRQLRDQATGRAMDAARELGTIDPRQLVRLLNYLFNVVESPQTRALLLERFPRPIGRARRRSCEIGARSDERSRQAAHDHLALRSLRLAQRRRRPAHAGVRHRLREALRTAAGDVGVAGTSDPPAAD